MAATVISSQELQAIMTTAARMARRHKREMTTLHVLIAALEVKTNSIKPILQNMGLELKGERGIQRAVEKLKELEDVERLEEPPDTLRLLQSKACEMAQRNESVVNSLFFFVTMIRMRKALGTRVLEVTGLDFARLRQVLLTRIGNLPRLAGVNASVEEESEEEILTQAREVPDDAAAEEGLADESAKTLTEGTTAAVKKARKAAPEAKEEVGERARELAERYGLDPDDFPTLVEWTSNITLRAALGEIDPVIGRDREMQQVIDILKKRRSNNPCLIGEPGVGKTALVEGLALEMVLGTPRCSRLEDRIVLELETGSLVAGTELRGSFSKRIKALREEVLKAQDRVIIFIDEIHTLVGTGGGESALDAANQLKSALARGQFPTIGATTLDEYKKHIEKDKALHRRFEQVTLAEPKADEAVTILQGVIEPYEAFHAVRYDPRALEAAVRFSVRYMPDRQLPAKAIEVLDSAGARVSGIADEVTEEDVARIVADLVGIPVERMLLSSGERFRRMEKALSESVVGHEEAINRICDTIKRGFAGFSSHRPLASFFFAGPPGVGKGQTARALARFLFDREDSILMFQGSEFTEKHSVAKLIGAGPGYVGYERGGRLTEGMYRKPFRLILFRDLLVAHPDVQELVAEMINTGVLTDGQNRRVHFSNAVVVVSQDLSLEKYYNGGATKRVGFAPQGEDVPSEQDGTEVLRRVVREFPASLLQAPDDRIVFFPLSHDEILDVVHLEVEASSARLQEERNIAFSLTREAAEHLIDAGAFTRGSGARRMRQTLARTVESFLADRIHSGEIRPGNRVTVDSDGDGLRYEISQPDSP